MGLNIKNGEIEALVAACLPHH